MLARAALPTALLTVLVLTGLALPVPARAGDVTLSVNGSGQFDTNTARTDGGGLGDFSFRLAPTIRVRDEGRRLSYGLQYSPTYQKFVERDEFDKLSHFASGSMGYRIGNKTSLSLTDSFKLTQSVNQQSLGADVNDVVGSPQAETRRGDVYLNVARFTARHSFTPRVSGQFNLTHQFFDSDNERSSKNTSLAGLSSLTYAISARDRVGLGGGVTFQQFDGIRGQPASDTFTYRIFASWLHTFGQNTEFSIRAGPALISTDQDRPEPEGVDLRYPHQDVGGTGVTVADLSAPVPIRGVLDPTGPILDPAESVPAGSILVPNDVCGSLVSSAFGGNPQSCVFSLLSRPNDPDQIAYINAVQTETQTFVFAPGTDPGKTSDSTITYFGEVSLKHNWTPNLSSSLLYSRSDSGASSLGSSSVADRVTIDTQWNPRGKLRLSFRADWVQRKSGNEITNTFRGLLPGPVPETPAAGVNPIVGVGYVPNLFSITTDNSIDTTYYSASARATYRLRPRLTLSARVTYQKQETDSASTTSNSDFGDFLGFVGFRYDLKPFHY